MGNTIEIEQLDEVEEKVAVEFQGNRTIESTQVFPADLRPLEALHQVLVHVRDLRAVLASVRSGEAFEAGLEQT